MQQLVVSIVIRIFFFLRSVAGSYLIGVKHRQNIGIDPCCLTSQRERVVYRKYCNDSFYF